MTDRQKISRQKPSRLSARTQYSEGVDQGGKAEIEIEPLHVIQRGSQTNPILNVTTAQERQETYNFEGSLCDMITECKGYSGLLQKYKSVPFHSAALPMEFMRSSPQSVPSPTDEIASPPILNGTSSDPTPGPSGMFGQTASEASTGTNPFFKHHKFYPERRPGKEPEVIRNILNIIIIT